MPGKPVQLVSRSDTGELDLTRELRSVSLWILDLPASIHKVFPAPTLDSIKYCIGTCVLTYFHNHVLTFFCNSPILPQGGAI